jgi:predicted ATPase
VSLGIAPRRIVIAGGPGSGKSTLLRALAESGETCYEECSRALIREQLAKSGQLLPWADLWAFAQECSARMQAQLKNSTQHQRSFFDRGLPDLVGYLNYGGRRAPDTWRDASRAYSPTVFFAPPWRDIFVNDRERPQTFAEAQALGGQIRRAYEDYGFRVVELAKSSVADRRCQVLDYLDTHPHESLS